MIDYVFGLLKAGTIKEQDMECVPKKEIKSRIMCFGVAPKSKLIDGRKKKPTIRSPWTLEWRSSAQT